MTINQEADVVVVGAGGTGLMAALTAADEGANVINLDKSNRVGGCLLISGGTTAGAAAKLQFAAGILGDSAAVFFADCMKESRAQQVGDSEVLMLYCQQSGFAVDWLDSLGGYKEDERKPRPPIYGEQWSFDRCFISSSSLGFLRVIEQEHKKRIDRGDVELQLNTAVTGLLVSNGRVAGVTARDGDGGTREIRAVTVILCTGGFCGSPELMIKYKFPKAKTILTGGLPEATGDGLVMCQDVGARLVNMGQEMLPYMGGVADPQRPGLPIAHINVNQYPGVIWVDKTGKRVAPEDAGAYTPATGKAMFTAPDMTLFVILDERIKQENPTILPAWYGSEERSLEWFAEKAQEGVIIQRGDTIEELSSKLNINPQALQDTIAQYNGYVAAGKDPEFGRKELNYRIVNPPFYAIRSVPTTLISSGGPAVNANLQVLNETGKVIPGLYAAGELPGYRGFGTGSLNIGCVIFGRHVGRMAARDSFRRG